MLGLVLVGALHTLFIDPALPSWIPEPVLRDLRVGDAKLTLRFWRDDGGGSRWEVLHPWGKLRVVRQPALESLTAGWTDRLDGILETLPHVLSGITMR
jgi:hypothetical protein